MILPQRKVTTSRQTEMSRDDNRPPQNALFIGILGSLIMNAGFLTLKAGVKGEFMNLDTLAQIATLVSAVIAAISLVIDLKKK